MSVVYTRAAGGELTAEERAALERIAAIPDSEIDYSDIPAVTDLSGWERGRSFRRAPVADEVEWVTLQLDARTVEWFQRHAAEPGRAGTEMAAVLRRYAATAPE